MVQVTRMSSRIASRWLSRAGTLEEFKSQMEREGIREAKKLSDAQKAAIYYLATGTGPKPRRSTIRSLERKGYVYGGKLEGSGWDVFRWIEDGKIQVPWGV